MEDLIYLLLYFLFWILPVMAVFFFRTLLARARKKNTGPDRKKNNDFTKRPERPAGKKNDFISRLARSAGIIVDEKPAAGRDGRYEYSEEEIRRGFEEGFYRHRNGSDAGQVHQAEEGETVYTENSGQTWKDEKSYEPNEESSAREQTDLAGRKLRSAAAEGRYSPLYSSTEHLSPVKRAFVFSEIFGQPKGLK